LGNKRTLRMKTIKINAFDKLFSWVQKASAYCVLERKIRDVKLTVAKARLYHKTEKANGSVESFDLSTLIEYEERFLAVLVWKRDRLESAMKRDHGWDPEDGEIGDQMLQKIALKHRVHASERSKGTATDYLWNVSATEPWLDVEQAEGPSSGDLAAAATLVSTSRKLERVVWCSRGECPGWKSNLLEDMKDILWLLLKGALDSGWYTVNELDWRTTADCKHKRRLERLEREQEAGEVKP